MQVLKSRFVSVGADGVAFSVCGYFVILEARAYWPPIRGLK